MQFVCNKCWPWKWLKSTRWCDVNKFSSPKRKWRESWNSKLGVPYCEGRFASTSSENGLPLIDTFWELSKELCNLAHVIILFFFSGSKLFQFQFTNKRAFLSSWIHKLIIFWSSWNKLRCENKLSTKSFYSVPPNNRFWSGKLTAR